MLVEEATQTLRGDKSGSLGHAQGIHSVPEETQPSRSPQWLKTELKPGKGNSYMWGTGSRY